MKLKNCLILCVAAITLTTIAQPSPPPRPALPPPAPAPGEGFSEKLHKIIAESGGATTPAPVSLTRFDLDFPGGRPRELVAALQKALSKPLNAIIPDDCSNILLPPLKMNNVDVPHLFRALEVASRKQEAYVTSRFTGATYGMPAQSWQEMTVSYGFQTTSDTPSDDSIWYFSVVKPSFPPLIESKSCRFYSLTRYLDWGLTVDDITTAIQTGWKMLGDKDTPSISFHKETKLLIAVGEASKLETIDAVLKALEPPKPKPGVDAVTGLPRTKAEPKPKE